MLILGDRIFKRKSLQALNKCELALPAHACVTHNTAFLMKEALRAMVNWNRRLVSVWRERIEVEIKMRQLRSSGISLVERWTGNQTLSCPRRSGNKILLSKESLCEASLQAGSVFACNAAYRESFQNCVSQIQIMGISFFQNLICSKSPDYLCDEVLFKTLTQLHQIEHV